MEFSPREWALICYFDAHQGVALSYDVILRDIFHNPALRKNTVVVTVKRINKKLEAIGCIQRIESVPTVGYRWM